MCIQRSGRRLLAALALLGSGRAHAARGDLSLGAKLGIADPGVRAALPGPAYGAELSVGLAEQLALEVGGGQSLHPVSSGAGGGTYALTHAGGGASLALDLTPIVPRLEAGAGAVWRSYAGKTAVSPWPYVGISLAAWPLRHLEVDLGLRYWLGTRADGSSQSYTVLVLGLGAARQGLTPVPSP